MEILKTVLGSAGLAALLFNFPAPRSDTDLVIGLVGALVLGALIGAAL